MAMLQRQTQSQRLQQRADPQLLLTNRILQMSSVELRQCVAQELAENPALESVDGGDCDHCVYPTARCFGCPFSPAFFRSSQASEEIALAAGAGPAEVDVDPLARVEAPQTLQEHLLRQLRANSQGAAELLAGTYLIENVDEDGYLRCSPEEAAQVTTVGLDTVHQAVALIQTFDPSGVGARTLQECLLIQAQALAQEQEAPEILVGILEEHWKEIAASRWQLIARRLRISVREVERTVDWLRRNLCPYPGRQYRPDTGEVAQRGDWVRPDVVVMREEHGGLSLQIPREEGVGLQVNPQYHDLWNAMRERPDTFASAERKHLREYLFRAQMFLKSLNDRTSILRQVAECLVSEQEQYFHSEREEDMMPLTQSQLSTFLRVHESTVSRAVADKYLQLPSGRVVPLSYFFDRALSQRALVANIVASENPAAPYSDQQIADLLRRQGVVIARRTVMKYREEMNILSSRQRGRTARS
jgi:RNA polymerase sigma-54 factor